MQTHVYIHGEKHALIDQTMRARYVACYFEEYGAILDKKIILLTMRHPEILHASWFLKKIT
jgi:hypothetical protein